MDKADSAICGLRIMLTPELRAWLQDYANDYGISMGAVIRIALSQFRRQESRIREAVIAEGKR